VCWRLKVSETQSSGKSEAHLLVLSVRTLERAKQNGSYAESSEVVLESIKSDLSSHESTDNENEMENDSRRHKRMKTSTY
jgi:hypothetical protein